MGTTLDLGLLNVPTQTKDLSQGNSETSENALSLSSALTNNIEKSSGENDSHQSNPNQQQDSPSFYDTLDKKLKQDKSDSNQTTESEVTTQEESSEQVDAMIEWISPPVVEIETPTTESLLDDAPLSQIENETIETTLLPSALSDTSASGTLPVTSEPIQTDLVSSIPQEAPPNASLETDRSNQATSPPDIPTPQMETPEQEPTTQDSEVSIQAAVNTPLDSPASLTSKKSNPAETETSQPVAPSSSPLDSMIDQMEPTQEAMESDIPTQNSLVSTPKPKSPTASEVNNPSAKVLTDYDPKESAGEGQLKERIEPPTPSEESPMTNAHPETINVVTESGTEASLEVGQDSSPMSPSAPQASILDLQSDPIDNIQDVGSGRVTEGQNPVRSVSQQILESVQASIQPEEKSITINLTPPELGRITIRFQEGQDGLQGELELSRSETRYEVEQALPQIMQSLQANGIQVRKMEVNVNVGDQSDAEPQQDLLDEQQSRDSQHQNPDDRWNQEHFPGGQSAPSDGTSNQRSFHGRGSVTSGYESSFDTDSINMLV